MDKIANDMKKLARGITASLRPRTLYCRVDGQYLDLFIVVKGQMPSARHLPSQINDAIEECDSATKILELDSGGSIKPSTRTPDSNVNKGWIIISRGMSIWDEELSSDDVEDLIDSADAKITKENPWN